jgi:endonuclease/exonuclease/phosphatase family metal-dependent hydrolase
VEHRISCLGEQVIALTEREPDIVALQEVTRRTAPQLREQLCHAGLTHTVDSLDLAGACGRRYGELIASRWPLRVLPPVQAGQPFPERVLSVVAECPWGLIELHTVHVVPGSRQGWKKIEMLRAIYQQLARHSEIPRILCGDFNEPQAELADGQLVTSRHRLLLDGRLVVKNGRPEAWEQAVLRVLEGLAEFDLVDIYRALRGYDVKEVSCIVRSTGHGYRYDHIFASRGLNPVACQYLHELRERGLSDHSPIEADFDPHVPG